MPFTLGFNTLDDLEEHFDKHNHDFGAVDELHYQRLADAFLGGPLGPTAHECVRRSDGCTLRYDHVTQEYGVLASDNYILSYYKPDPRKHKQRTNMGYFRAECNKK